MQRSNTLSVPSSHKSAAFQFASSVSGTANNHFCRMITSAISNVPSALTSPFQYLSASDVVVVFAIVVVAVIVVVVVVVVFIVVVVSVTAFHF